VASAAFAGEVIVADAGSTDGTVEAARAAGAIVLERTGPTIAAQRNAAIARARHRWVFALDADERFTPALAAELAKVLAAPGHAAYRVGRRNLYLGGEQAGVAWARDWAMRLFQRDRRFIERRVHEGLEPVADPGTLTEPILHQPYRSLAHQIRKMHQYAEWGASDLCDQGYQATWSDLALRPVGRFLKVYVLGRGMLDGRRGLVQAAMDAYGVFLKYALLWELRRDGGPGAREGRGEA
jgi:glycosyltransferase involved in cell wall biosynthesis